MAPKDDLNATRYPGTRSETALPWIAGAPVSAPTEPTIPVKLTRREHEVLCLVVKGYSSQEAADDLCLAKRTIDFHLANIYEKLRVNNRVQAFRAAARLGLISVERA